MENVRIYFSYYQAKSSLLANLSRRFSYRRTLTRLMSAQGIEYGTILPAQGIYKATLEPSFILELYLDNTTAMTDQADRIRNLCQDIKESFVQDSVMLVTPSQGVDFI